MQKSGVLLPSLGIIPRHWRHTAGLAELICCPLATLDVGPGQGHPLLTRSPESWLSAPRGRGCLAVPPSPISGCFPWNSLQPPLSQALGCVTHRLLVPCGSSADRGLLSAWSPSPHPKRGPGALAGSLASQPVSREAALGPHLGRASMPKHGQV